MLDEFSGSLPGVKTALIDERDAYLAARIDAAGGECAGGRGRRRSRARYQAAVRYAHRHRRPRRLCRRPIALRRYHRLGVPAILLAGLVAAGFFFSGRDTGEQMIIAWVLANGIAAAAGTILALAHPLTIVTAFFAAPITSLNPTIAAGWVCGLVEAWVRKPRVRDLERVADDVSSLRGIWSNRVTRVLLVVILANLGSSVGTFVGVGWIVTLLGR